MLNGDLNTRTWLEDGDSATYSSFVDSKPYGDESVPKKLEVQKRVGSRLRKLKSTYKGTKLSDEKSLAARENLDDVAKMAKAMKATLYHVASSDEKPQHHLCPDGEDRGQLV
ncbi:Hypothetical predicted protein [Paramuricea clavata]|uniref:Uncharacterized protein n=1 Tax=Paramuricea clavata TaxID=317549 RepID=A0A6S7IWW8_PARCT|nr:Hypothetical predicted protein [Paramuricea clavata]